MNVDTPYSLVVGNSADMVKIQSDEADFVLTSPPYFSEETEDYLKQPRKSQVHVDLVQQQIVAFAFSLRPIFLEIRRILKPGAAFVLQTKDIHYGDCLLGLADVHRNIAESSGFRLVTRVYWQDMYEKRHTRLAGKKVQVGALRTQETEAFLVFAGPEGLRARSETIDLDNEEAEACRDSVWRLPGPGGGKTHPYQSPKSVIRRLITLYSALGDLVVDPFAGHGTTLRVALESGRRAMGYEIDQANAAKAATLIERSMRCGDG